MQLEVRDKQGVKSLKFEEAAKYHGGFHTAGVALGWKLLEAAVARCGRPLSRDGSLLTLGATPPGLADCLEYATRAFSRRRAIVDRNFMDGPEICCGRLSFAISCGDARIAATVRDGLLPRDFVHTAGRMDAGLAGEEEITGWRGMSLELAGRFLEQEPEALFNIIREESRDKGPGNGQAGEAYPLADYAVSDQPPLRVRDDSGEFDIGLDELLRFHDKDHYAGVVLAYKLLTLAFQELWSGEIPHRRDITILSGLNPPGLIDSFEYAARAVSRQRHCLISNSDGAPGSPFGAFVFQVSNGKESCNLRLRHGLLPEDFASLGRKAEAGLADQAEQARWESYKRDIGKALADMEPADILEIL